MLDKILRRLIPFICVGVAVSLAFSWFGTDRSAIQTTRFSWGWLLVAMAAALGPWLWHCLRLSIWGRFFGVNISLRNLLRIVVATDVGGVVMPTAVGGGPLKLAMLVRNGYRPGQAATLTLWGNIEDALFYLLAIPVSLSLTQNWNNPLWPAAAGFLKKYQHIALPLVLGILSILLIIKFLLNKKKQTPPWWEKLAGVLGESRAAFRQIGKKGRKPFLLSMLAHTGQWCTRFCILLAVVKMLGLEADFGRLLVLQWMVFVAALLVPSPGGMGGVEAAFLLVFANSLPDGSAGMVLLGWRLLSYYLVLVTGAFFLAATNGLGKDALPQMAG